MQGKSSVKAAFTGVNEPYRLILAPLVAKPAGFQQSVKDIVS